MSEEHPEKEQAGERHCMEEVTEGTAVESESEDEHAETRRKTAQAYLHLQPSS